MLRVGLTGNVAAGKSAVLDLFKQWGAAVTDHDLLAREALAPGSPGLAQVRARFGDGVFAADGSLDRAALRRIVMADANEREALNAIVHPEVARLARLRESELEVGGAKIVVHDIPLLFEVLDPALFGAIVLVDAPEAVRRQRMMRNRGLPAADADALMAAQQPGSSKRNRSHFVIDNDGDRAALETRARAVWRKLQEQAGIV